VLFYFIDFTVFRKQLMQKNSEKTMEILQLWMMRLSQFMKEKSFGKIN